MKFPAIMIEQVNANGFATIDLSKEKIVEYGREFYSLMDQNYNAPGKGQYFNEIGFNWTMTEMTAAKSFHDLQTLNYIKSLSETELLLKEIFGMLTRPGSGSSCKNLPIEGL